ATVNSLIPILLPDESATESAAHPERKKHKTACSPCFMISTLRGHRDMRREPLGPRLEGRRVDCRVGLSGDLCGGSGAQSGDSVRAIPLT
ncbi:hypothetical protein KUCAC02_007351, partial [Chaenocephalus aceratus]